MREKVVDHICLDFGKGFDTVTHRILDKLAAHGMDRCSAGCVEISLDGQAQ